MVRLQWPGAPYWCDDNVAVYCGDSLELIKAWPRKSVDLIVADPPYGSEYQSGFGQHQAIHGDDDRSAVPALLASVFKPLNDGAHAYVFGFQADELPGLFTSAVDLVWDKGSIGMGDLSVQWGSSHEPITFGVYYSDRRNKVLGRGGLTARLRKGSVLRVGRMNSGQTTRHPTEKPVKLLRQLIESSSVVDDVVLDPFAGVGSTGVAAVLLGRRAVCIEIDEGYCLHAVGRLRAASAILAKAVAI
jgi:DNA modification methylase